MKKLLLILALAAAGLQGRADEPTDYLAIVGGATKAGWPGSPNADNRSVGQMVKTGDHTWVWVGELKTGNDDDGNFKIPWSASGWNGYWANSDDLSVGDVDTKTYTLSTNGSGDVKYHVNSTGIYRITIYDTNNTPKMKVDKLTAPTSDGGYYQIGTVDEFMWFAGYATSNGATAKAKLTANLDFSSTNYFPIGCETYKFQGELDGNGKSITLGINSTSKYQGLIGHATGGATIKNLIIKGSVTGAGNTAALIGEIRGGGTITISQVGCEATVSSSGSCVGAFVGNNWGWSTAVNVTNSYNIGDITCTADGTAYSSIIGNYIQDGSSCTNVYNKGTISGGSGQFADPVGRTKASFTNCYTKTNTGGTIEGLTQGISDTQITLGELCYKLNNNTSVWKQKIGGEKGYPNLYDDTDVVNEVVANTTYSNLNANNGKVQIDDAVDLVQFSAEVKAGNTSMNAELTYDIDMTGVTGWTPIGQHLKDYAGHFNGQGHRILNLTTSVGFNNQALFGQAVGPAIIENVIIDASCTIKGDQYAAGILGHVYGSHSDGVTIRNCGNEAAIQGNSDTCAGIVGCAEKLVHISNCYNTGNISGTQWNAGICGWMDNMNSTIKNCYSIGSVSGSSTAPIWRASGTLNEGNATNNYTTLDGQGNKINNLDDVTSGKLCYLLNGNTVSGNGWYQNLAGQDAHPYPFNTHKSVYEISSTSHTNLPVDGSGNVQISNADDLMTFSAEVNAGNNAMNTILTGDIDMTGKGGSYVPIGTDNKKYSGTFDGQGFRIKNLVINTDTKEQGLFSVCAGGATIKNLIMDSSCSIRCNNTTAPGNAAFVAVCNGSGTLTFENCGNEASVYGAYRNNAAFLGFNWCNNGSLSVSINNCYNIGDISGEENNGAFIGWNWGNSYSITNSYNIGEISNYNADTNNSWGYSEGDKNFTNCYGTQYCCDFDGLTSSYPLEKVTSGELCFRLNGDQSEIAFTQDLSQEGHPIFGSKVVHVANWFDADKWDIFYNEEGSSRTAYVLNLDETKTSFNLDPNFTLTAKNVSVARNIPAGEWIGLCLPFDYDIPSGWEVRELTGVTGSGESASMKFSAASSIEAGKPYIVKPTEDVTSFTVTNKEFVAESTDVTIGDVTMVGNLNQTSIARGSFYINTSSQLRKLNADSATLKGFRAYFTVAGGSGVKALAFAFDDDATGIENLNVNDNLNEGAIYNLAGQRLNKAQKGINIINGKKILK